MRQGSAGHFCSTWQLQQITMYSGQNKNKGMLEFCCWLVEAGYVKKVTLLFLIKGHTKNDADRKFNLLKRGQDGEDIWTDVELDVALTKKNKEFIDFFPIG